MTEREMAEVTDEMESHWPPYTPTDAEMEDAHKAHLASVEAELTKTKDLLMQDDAALAFWKRYRGEM